VAPSVCISEVNGPAPLRPGVKPYPEPIMRDPAVLFLMIFAAGGLAFILIRGFYSWPRGFFAGEEIRHEPPTTLEKALRTGISLWLVWVAVPALLTSRLSIIVPWRFDPSNLNRAARIVLHGPPLIVMCLACFCGAAALMLELAWWWHLDIRPTPYRWVLRGLSFLAVVCFGGSLWLWLYAKITQ
jgi:hypothetical protein